MESPRTRSAKRVYRGRLRRYGRFITSIFGILVWTSHGAGASATALQESAGSACSVQFDRLVTLGESGGGVVSATFRVARGSRFYYVAPTPWIRDEIYVFDREGKFIRSSGDNGAGPGEFRFIRALEVAAGDTLHVFDLENQRWTVLSPNLALVTTRPLPGRVLEGGATFLTRDSVVLNMSVPSSDRRSFPLHVLSREARIIRSFGARQGADLFGEGDRAMLRHTARVRRARGQIWVAHADDYRIERWDLSGRLLQTIDRAAEWFTSISGGDRSFKPGDPIPPRSVVLDLREDVEGRLWISGRTMDPEWRSAIANGKVKRWNDYADTVVEVIDPGSERLITSCHLPYYFAAFLEDDLLYTFRESEAAVPVLDIWRARLAANSGRDEWSHAH